MNITKEIMHPIFQSGTRVALVESIDKPGMLAVAVRGGRYVCPLPEGYDMNTSITMHEGYVLVAHPYLPPLQCDTNTGTVNLISPDHIQAKPGRLKLVTR